MNVIKGNGLDRFTAEVANPASNFGLILGNQSRDRSLPGLGGAELRGLLHQHGFVIVRGCVVQKDEFRDLMARLGPLAEFASGAVVDLGARSPTDETAFSSREMRFHQDGAPFAQKSGYVGLFCQIAPTSAEGGETYLSFLRGFMRRSSPGLLERLRRLSVEYRTRSIEFEGYGKADNSRSQRCLIRHPETKEELVYISLNNARDENYSFVSRFGELDAAGSEAMMLELEQEMYNPEIFYEHKWRDGDCMIIDNLLVSHGRRAFDPASKRRVIRVTTKVTSPLWESDISVATVAAT